ncbi:MAG: PIN domain-containing protein [Pseudomonadota bacterium]
MFANRYTAFIDACSLVDTLRRNFLLTLGEAEFFRLRWSDKVLEETEVTIERLLTERGKSDARERALRSIRQMKAAFPEALVTDFSNFEEKNCPLPDENDAHVLGAALKAQAQAIVTENLKDFPATVLHPRNLEARSADDFIADTIALDTGRAIKAVRKMRERLRRPEKTPDVLLRDCEARGLLATAAQLKPFIELI